MAWNLSKNSHSECSPAHERPTCRQADKPNENETLNARRRRRRKDESADPEDLDLGSGAERQDSHSLCSRRWQRGRRRVFGFTVLYSCVADLGREDLYWLCVIIVFLVVVYELQTPVSMVKCINIPAFPTARGAGKSLGSCYCQLYRPNDLWRSLFIFGDEERVIWFMKWQDGILLSGKAKLAWDLL